MTGTLLRVLQCVLMCGTFRFILLTTVLLTLTLAFPSSVVRQPHQPHNSSPIAVVGLRRTSSHQSYVPCWIHTSNHVNHNFKRSGGGILALEMTDRSKEEHSNSHKDDDDEDDEDDGPFQVQVSYQGRTVDISVQRDETILDAIERSGAADQLAMPSCAPSDCRKGNCMTCVATLEKEDFGTLDRAKTDLEGEHRKNMNHMISNTNNFRALVRGQDGLAPFQSKLVRSRGYILTCSSYVVAHGLQLVLGENDGVWQDLYRSRLTEESTQEVGRAASARVMRLAAEQNVPKWTKQTEEMLNRSSSTGGGEL